MAKWAGTARPDPNPIRHGTNQARHDSARLVSRVVPCRHCVPRLKPRHDPIGRQSCWVGIACSCRPEPTPAAGLAVSALRRALAAVGRRPPRPPSSAAHPGCLRRPTSWLPEPPHAPAAPLVGCRPPGSTPDHHRRHAPLARLAYACPQPAAPQPTDLHRSLTGRQGEVKGRAGGE